MSDQTKKFEKQVKNFETAVLKALAKNPELSSYKLGSVMLVPEEDVDETEGYDLRPSLESNLKSAFTDSSRINIRPRHCKIDGQPYWGYPCPVHGERG